MKSSKKIALIIIIALILILIIVGVAKLISNQRKIRDRVNYIKNGSIYMGQEFHYTDKKIEDTDGKHGKNKRRYEFYKKNNIIYRIKNDSKVFGITKHDDLKELYINEIDVLYGVDNVNHRIVTDSTGKKITSLELEAILYPNEASVFKSY